MNPKETESVARGIAALRSAAESIRRIEMEARDALFSRNEPETYRQKLQEKTMLLMELPELVEPFLDGMPEKIRIQVEAGASGFARRAVQARELSSLFYMGALLYPQDYREGQRNDLENFIDRLRKVLSPK